MAVIQPRSFTTVLNAPVQPEADRDPACGSAFNLEIVHIVDPDARSRGRLFTAVASRPDRLVFSHGTLSAFAASWEEWPSGVVLLSASLPMDEVREGSALAHDRSRARVILLSDGIDIAQASWAVRAHIQDVIPGSASAQQVVAVVDEALAAIDVARRQAHQQAEAVSRLARLTCREREVARSVAFGASNKAIARALDLSVRTVELHRARLMSRLATEHATHVAALFARADPAFLTVLTDRALGMERHSAN